MNRALMRRAPLYIFFRFSKLERPHQRQSTAAFIAAFADLEALRLTARELPGPITDVTPQEWLSLLTCSPFTASNPIWSFTSMPPVTAHPFWPAYSGFTQTYGSSRFACGTTKSTSVNFCQRRSSNSPAIARQI